MLRGRTSVLLPRDLHPMAWWAWALGLATAASRTTHPVVLVAIIAVACHVVVSRRSEAPWAMAFRIYLYLAAAVVVLRVAFRIVFGGGGGPTVLVTLPQVPLPEWVAGIQLLGPVSAEALLGGLYDGLRLAAMIVCLGAANALANPKRLLKAMPPALHEVGTAVVVALSVFPQLAESVQRVRRARRLRGGSDGRLRVLRSIVVPVLEDALDRSLQLAASMDSRGYGRRGTADARERRLTGALMVLGLLGVCIGVYATLDATTPRWLATPVLVVGLLLALGGFTASGRRVQRSRYRPDRWRLPELLTVGSGVAVVVGLVLAARSDPLALYPSIAVASWPGVPTAAVLAVLVGLLPSFLTPRPEAAAPTGPAGHERADDSARGSGDRAEVGA